jgi:hypothetical protein
MSNIKINGMNPYTTRVAVQIYDLERIGDELRVHFDKKQEGTTRIHTGTGPLVIKGGGMKKMGPGYYEYIEKNLGTGWTDYVALAASMYNEYFDPDVYIGQMAEPDVATIQIPGASKIKIKMSYARESSGKFCYLWIGKGLHEKASEIQGEYFPFFSAKGCKSWEKLEGHSTVCAGCGLPVVNGDLVWAPDTNLHPCEDENGYYPILHTGPLLPCIEREIEGDSFTVIWNVDFTGNDYTQPDEANYIGYYIEIIPYDADGNPVTTAYQFIANEIPRSFSIDDMDFMISKLNNYPNAEEVKF